MKLRDHLPDLLLGYIVFAVCFAATLAVEIVAHESGKTVILYAEPKYIALAYILFEGVRTGKPLAGCVAGAIAGASLAFPYVLAGLSVGLRWFKWGEGAEILFGAVGLGGVLGAVFGGLSWLARRLFRLKRQAVPAARPRIAGGRLAAAVSLAVLLVLEAYAWAYQGAFREVLGLWESDGNPWHDWGIFYRLDRVVLVSLCALGLCALFRRWRGARVIVAGYLAAGIVITLVRAWFYREMNAAFPLPEFGLLSLGTGEYQCANMVGTLIPSIPFESLARANLIEAGLRVVIAANIALVLFRPRRSRAEPATHNTAN